MAWNFFNILLTSILVYLGLYSIRQSSQIVTDQESIVQPLDTPQGPGEVVREAREVSEKFESSPVSPPPPPPVEAQLKSEPIESGSLNGHLIVAEGWPSTSPMWPTVEANDEPDAKKNDQNSTEPFIYVDKPLSTDYGLLLNLSQATIEKLKTFNKPVMVDLSLEFYLNHGPQVNALPGLKIEVDRQQIKNLIKPDEQTKTKKWHKFNEKIKIDDPTKFENHDWLKLSLVNRKAPSIVAIRKLKIEFSPATEEKDKEKPSDGDSSDDEGSKKKGKKPHKDIDSPYGEQTEDVMFPTTEAITASSKEPSVIKKIFGRKKRETTSDDEETKTEIDTETDPEAQSKGQSKSIKTNQETTVTPKVEDIKPIVLTCYRADSCDIKFDSKDEIQWSLPRMPPSTDSVQNGYYYVSNKKNYGDPSKMLHIYLNQTQSATITDQTSDHCIDIALFITESIQLDLYLLRLSGGGKWTRARRILTWAPTIAPKKAIKAEDANKDQSINRIGLPGTTIADGWTQETLCFGDFFINPRECNEGKCGFGFEVRPENQSSVTTTLKPDTFDEHSTDSDTTNKQSTDDEASNLDQVSVQVAGVALLRESAVSIPRRNDRSKWLESWQRDEVSPSDDWRFFPRQDYQPINEDKINKKYLTNLYDGAQYFIVSDWLEIGSSLDLVAELILERIIGSKNGQENLEKRALTLKASSEPESKSSDRSHKDSIFGLDLTLKVVDSSFEEIFKSSERVDFMKSTNGTVYSIAFSLTPEIQKNYPDLKLKPVDNLIKIIFEIQLKSYEETENALKDLTEGTNFKLSLANLSVSDRCFPNPCQFGHCKQIGTRADDLVCECDDKHRGERCEFGLWCLFPHIAPYDPNQERNQITTPSPNRKPKTIIESSTKVTGREYCKQKLGPGSKCTELDVPLNNKLYNQVGETFTCTCQDDYWLNDEGKCRPAHLCSSIICPGPGMICDETKPFNREKPCKCNESQSWFPDPSSDTRCIRRQCQDKERDCQFDAHICLPTITGESPICKCGSKFTLVTDSKGKKSCQSAACNIPSLNDCQQICVPDNRDKLRPYTCTCYPGWKLNTDGVSCSAQKPDNPPKCYPQCNGETQICTDLGCKCKRGYASDAETNTQKNLPSNPSTLVSYTQTVRCLNICSLNYAEKRDEFEKVKSVCPFGLCDPKDFQCKCSDPELMSVAGNKYEVISKIDSNERTELMRVSPLCRLRRVCQPDSDSFKICQAQGAICVPDYTKPSMYDCVCPPSFEKRIYGQGSPSEFTCEPKCGATRGECLRKNAICKPIDKDRSRCECLPGFMFDDRDGKCYLATYSYSFNIVVANKYYDPEQDFNRLISLRTNETLTEITGPEYKDIHTRDIGSIKNDPSSTSSTTVKPTSIKTIITSSFNQCNIAQIVPKAVLDDPYEHDIEYYQHYIDQCNEKIRKNIKTHYTNYKLTEDLKQTLRQHLNDFSVTTTENSCSELDNSGRYLNCTIYLQSKLDSISSDKLGKIFSQCDKQGQSEEYCWIKPKLLLRKPHISDTSATPDIVPNYMTNFDSFKQIIPCELEHFCGQDAVSVRIDNSTSLCSCKCKPGIEINNVKQLEYHENEDVSKIPVQEICIPMDHCKANPTFCLAKPDSVCHHDSRYGSRCICQYPKYEREGVCVSPSDEPGNALQIIVIIVLVILVPSVIFNIWFWTKHRSGCGNSKEYQLNEFASTPTFKRPQNRSTGVPNPVFTND